ncbi:unnamed protein product [Triticum turgidum subsp. durum]|uniref:Protein kinase domain-containing protein n=1 Tax=Triticum turgidum subsp. durum TaxID=4567 RepID=A0A9R1C664_TRITD|nr:unnamed protein product [Triticum turgidum subsp. durum]
MQRTRDDLEKKLHDSNTTPMFFPLEFLKAITCDFSTESVLGEGGFGVVYKGVLRSGKVIAVKKLFEIRLKEDTFQNEVRYLMGIKHQKIVQFLGYCAESSWEAIEQPSGSGKFIFGELPKRLLCFEYVCNKSLDNHISDESSGLEWNMRYEIIKGICNGLHFLHEECHMVHLDLKPENILMDSTMIPKIADFGLSRIFGEQQTRIVTDNRAGTCGYMAPEYLIRGVVSNKADIFSLGVILIEIITGDRDYPYFHHDRSQRDATTFQQFTEKVLENWRNRFTSTPKYTKEKYAHQVKQCVTIALKCVDPSMEKRPTAKHIIQVFNVADQMETHEELPSVVQCVDKLLALNTTGSKDLTPMSATEEMLIIKAATGKQVDEAKSEGLLPMPTIEPSTIRQSYQEGVKACNERQSATETESETIQPLIQIIDYGAGPGIITCIDANQTEPLIMTGDTRGCVKIWNYDTESQASYGIASVWSLDSLKSKYTLSGHLGTVYCLDFFTRDGQQYLISGSFDGTAKIWDLHKKECVHTLEHECHVYPVFAHPSLPVLITATSNGAVRVWSSTNFRLKKKLEVDSPVRGFACLTGSERVAVAHFYGVSVMKIGDEEAQGGSEGNNENSVSAIEY